MINPIEVDSTKTPIEAVCIYLDRADVHRSYSVELKAGQNEVHLKNLSNRLDEDSIRVEGLNNATIFDVIYKSPRSATPVDQDPDLRTAKKRLSALQSEETVLKDQTRFLNEYAKTLGADKAMGMELDQFLKLYGDEKKRINGALTDLTYSLEEARKEVTNAEEQLSQDDQAMKRTASVVLVVLAESDGHAELSLRYVVDGASWAPFYDLRVTLPPGQDRALQTSKPRMLSNVSLQYRASIVQNTGEDWSSVDLSLSTASPGTDSTIPTIDLWRIGVKTEQGLGKGGAKRHRRILSPESVTSATFTVDGVSDIPCRKGSVNNQTHKVVIAVIDMMAKLEWIVIPKEKESAFLRCQVKNTSPYFLLEGEASMYMGNNFVCRTEIPVGLSITFEFLARPVYADVRGIRLCLQDVSPQETFSASLGVDPSIRITRHPYSKKTKTSSSSLGSILALQSKTDVTSHVQRFTIKNARGTRISPLIVKDRVPVSVDSVVKITVNEPKELGEARDRKEVDVSTGVKARWAIRNGQDEEESGGVEEEGVVEWVCDLDAGKSVDLALAWDLTLPIGQSWEDK
ncbi:hypothetical protein FRB95_010436 [Tulasnella sp. JGI-2019a]|nr:hypothetical protein FRB95_010436 [Tulasnella sp. JGI-2019a]